MFGCEEDSDLNNGGEKRGKKTCYTLLYLGVDTFMCLFPLFCV